MNKEMIWDYKEANINIYEKRDYNNILENIYAPINSVGNYCFYIGWKTIRWFIRTLGEGHDYKKIKLLDVGCGDGHISRMMASLINNCENIYGFDLSKNNIENCRKLNSSINYEEGDIVQEIPFKNMKFDGISAFVILSHLRKKKDIICALKNIYNSLDDKGLFLWYELVSRSHYSGIHKDTEGFSYKEMKNLTKKIGFEEIAHKSFSKTITIGKINRSIYYYANERNIWFLELLAKILPFRPTITIRIYKKI